MLRSPRCCCRRGSGGGAAAAERGWSPHFRRLGLAGISCYSRLHECLVHTNQGCRDSACCASSSAGWLPQAVCGVCDRLPALRRTLFVACRPSAGNGAQCALSAATGECLARTRVPQLVVRVEVLRRMPVRAPHLQSQLRSVQHAADTVQHAACNMQPTTCSVQRAAYNRKWTPRNVQHVACNMRRTPCSVQHATCNMPRGRSGPEWPNRSDFERFSHRCSSPLDGAPMRANGYRYSSQPAVQSALRASTTCHTNGAENCSKGGASPSPSGSGRRRAPSSPGAPDSAATTRFDVGPRPSMAVRCDVEGARPVPLHMWQGVSPAPVQM